jgi:hypothetical protein
MTRYKYTTTVELDGKKVAIRVGGSRGLDDIANATKNRLEAAIELLTRTDTILKTSPLPAEVIKYANKYFLPRGGVIYKEDWDRIKLVISVKSR